MAVIGFCFISQAVGWRTSSRRANAIELIPPLACVSSKIARNHIVSGGVVLWKIVPVVNPV